MTSRKRERYSRGDSSAACSKWFRSRMVFCCFRTPAYCLRKSLQKSSNPFMDFSGSYLNHNRAGPARVAEKTLQVTASSLVSKAIFCWKWYMWSRGVRVAVPRQPTLGASERQLSRLGSDWPDRLGSVMGTLELLTPTFRRPKGRWRDHVRSAWPFSWYKVQERAPHFLRSFLVY
ncbi:hypothetical protein PanWU01x14_074980 [Parasponia andersonii]|uniref:Uncharacterized protein n=1 Tax=Parasponia andersonii TaxID=3476 RepID=A0A2P5DDI7_PARAD|nr:hypothetical protein PanWU01x14_074980 [Parasponia andersonii]